MPSARNPFGGVRQSSFLLQSMDSSSGPVHVNSPDFNSTAEVTAEANLLRENAMTQSDEVVFY